MDPGSDCCYVHERALPKGAAPKITKSSPVKTLNGTTKCNRVVKLDGLILPEFSRSRRIDNAFVYFVSNQDMNTDMILGNDFLQAIGINCNGNNAIGAWFKTSMLCKPGEHFDDKNEMCMDFLESLFPNEALNDDEEHESNLAQTLEAKYPKVDVKEVAQNQKHLTIKRRKELAALLSDYNKLFSGELGLCPHRKTAPQTN
jgi:hypothetical protein